MVVQQHLTLAAPDVRAFRSDVPAYLAEAIARGLLKDPAERWQTAELMRTAMHGGG
jgi:hypothetical protein